MIVHPMQHERPARSAPPAPPSGYVALMSVKPVQFELAAHGRVLATRNAGRRVATHLSGAIEQEPAVMVSFADVEAVTPPFLDELLRVVRGVLSAERDGRMVAVTHLDDDLRETLQLVLDRSKMSLAELREGRLELLTAVPHLAETLDAAQDLGTEYFTAPQLADRLELKLPNANQRLTQLVQAGALAREPDPDAARGRRYRYSTRPFGARIAQPA
jgi:DNA-binding MarR family transcriptional regulator